MNRRGDKGFHVPRKMPNRFKDKEEELSFFRDIQKRDKERSLASLLQPVSEEFEANGNYGFYTMEPRSRRNPGIELLAAENGKSDYNWLKTPPATPLFPSLEMEVNAQEQVVHKELPIFQPLSRFAGNLGSNRTSDLSSAPPNPKLPQRHKTPTGKSSISSSNDKKNVKTAPILNSKTNQKVTNHQDNTKQAYTHAIKSNIIINKEIQSNFLASKSIGKDADSNARPKSRGISSFSRQSVPILSDETPANLRATNRPASANRGRPTNQNNYQNAPQKQDSITISTKTRRQSCSPSVTRGRKMETIDGNNVAPQNASTIRKVQQARNNQAQVSGSRMVDKLMNARTSYNKAAKTKF